MKKLSVKCLSLLLSVLLLFSGAQCLFTAASAQTISEPTEKSKQVSQFNAAVNALKTARPAMHMTYETALFSATTGSRTTGEEMSEEAKRYLAWILDACLVDGSGLAETLADTINGVPRLPSEVDFSYGEKRDNRVPLSGKKYVSALKSTDKFTLTKETTGGTLLRPEAAITTVKASFPSCTIEKASASAMTKVFDLPSPAFDPVIVSGDKSAKDSDGPLSDIRFDEFLFDNAFAQAKFDSSGKLLSYTTSIDYTFEVSMYDALRIVSAYTKMDIAGTAVGIAESVFAARSEKRSGKDILKNYVIFVTYRSAMSISSIDNSKRYFGDTDNDGKVTSTDARLILRRAVGFEDPEFGNQMNEVYSDINFDGTVSSADARMALRIAVGLSSPFKNVPDGKKIRIVFAGDVLEPDEPEDDDKPGDPFAPVDPTEPEEEHAGLADVVGTFTVSIKDLIKKFQNISEEDNKEEIGGMLDELMKNLGQ